MHNTSDENKKYLSDYQDNILNDDIPEIIECEGLKYYSNPESLLNRLYGLYASYNAGNTSTKLYNEAHNILKELLKINHINKEQYLALSNLFKV